MLQVSFLDQWVGEVVDWWQRRQKERSRQGRTEQGLRHKILKHSKIGYLAKTYVPVPLQFPTAFAELVHRYYQKRHYPT